jgi:hypothetical protein
MRQSTLFGRHRADFRWPMSLQELPERQWDRLFRRLALPTPALTVQGTVQTFTGRGDSGKATYRRFCPECGSALIDEAEIMPNVTMIMAGTLDDPSWVTPAMEIYCDSAQPWVQLGGDRERFPKMPAS